MKPSFITTMRSPMVMASVWSWVTYTKVVPRRLCSLVISERICPRSLASRLESGSSSRNTAGSRTMARPRATRCRCPPERALGLRSSRCSISRILAASCTLASISFSPACAAAGRRPCSYTRSCGDKGRSSGTPWRCPGPWGPRRSSACRRISNSPLVISSSPAIIRSVVDLPQPEGPTRMINSPSWISRQKSCTAVTPPDRFCRCD